MQGPWEPPRGDPWQMAVISQGGLLLVRLPWAPHSRISQLSAPLGLFRDWPIILASSGLLSCRRIPEEGQKPTCPGLRKWTRPRRTRASLRCKTGICTTDPSLQPRAPFTSILPGGLSGERFSFLRAQLYMISRLLLPPTRKNQPQGKAALWNLSVETLKGGDQNI